MRLEIISKAFLVWLGVLLLAIANGILREWVLVPQLGSLTALVLSGMLLSAFLIAVAYVTLPWFGHLDALRYLQVGLVWLVLTLVFEFGFGRLVQHKPWAEILQAYTFEGGNIWPVVLLITVLAPFVAAKLRGAA